jgi:hypothetical protein
LSELFEEVLDDILIGSQSMQGLRQFQQILQRDAVRGIQSHFLVLEIENKLANALVAYTALNSHIQRLDSQIARGILAAQMRVVEQKLLTLVKAVQNRIFLQQLLIFIEILDLKAAVWSFFKR